MRSIKKIGIIVITLILAVSAVFTMGCNCTNDTTLTRENAIVFKGNSDYKIVIPKEANGSETTAVMELNTFLSEATGVTLPVVTDDTVNFSEDAKYISLGNTTLMSEAGVEKNDEQLGRSGFIIATKGKSYFLAGRDKQVTKGTLYAVYDFLNEVVGYEYFAPECYSLNKSENVAFKEINKVEIPDI